MSAPKTKISRKAHIQILLLIGVILIAGTTLNRCAYERKKLVSEMRPEIVAGNVSSINLLPHTNGYTVYIVGVKLESGEYAKLSAPIDLATKCEIGETIRIEKRGIDYRFSDEFCND